VCGYDGVCVCPAGYNGVHCAIGPTIITPRQTAPGELVGSTEVHFTLGPSSNLLEGVQPGGGTVTVASSGSRTVGLYGAWGRVPRPWLGAWDDRSISTPLGTGVQSSASFVRSPPPDAIADLQRVAPPLPVDEGTDVNTLAPYSLYSYFVTVALVSESGDMLDRADGEVVTFRVYFDDDSISFADVAVTILLPIAVALIVTVALCVAMRRGWHEQCCAAVWLDSSTDAAVALTTATDDHHHHHHRQHASTDNDKDNDGDVQLRSLAPSAAEV